MNLEIFDFYKNTSPYTELGLYKKFAVSLTNNIKELCYLQRKQIIHPINLIDNNRFDDNIFFGDKTKIPYTRLNNEDDIYPTALSMIAELFRKDNNYTENRKVEDKIHITCRGQAILLAAILKAKGIPARVRSGFTLFKNEGVYHDHWITEYYGGSEKKWILVDADMCCNDLDFNPYDIPKDYFLTAAKAYLNIRNNILKPEQIYSAEFEYNSREKYIIPTIVKALMYDFHCLMNNEIIYLHYPKYFKEKNFILNEYDYEELEYLSKLMLEPNDNFEELMEIWNNNEKYRIMCGGLNH